MQLTGGRGRSLRATAAVLVALALVAAACGSDDDETASVTPEGGGPITTLVTGAEGMDIPAADDAGGIDAGSGDGDGSGEDGPPDGADGPDRFGAPAPGRYRYVVPGSEDEPNGRFFYWFGDLEHRGDSLLQARQVAGNTFDNRAELIWTATGEVLVAREQRSSQGEIAPVCDWEPDLLLYPADLSVGATWQAESTCAGSQGGTRTRTEEGRVVGAEAVDVGGVSVPVVVVERTEVTTSTVKGVVIVERSEQTERFSQDLGLRVAMEGSRTAEFPGAPEGANDFRERLAATRPE